MQAGHCNSFITMDRQPGNMPPRGPQLPHLYRGTFRQAAYPANPSIDNSTFSHNRRQLPYPQGLNEFGGNPNYSRSLRGDGHNQVEQLVGPICCVRPAPTARPALGTGCAAFLQREEGDEKGGGLLELVLCLRQQSNGHSEYGMEVSLGRKRIALPRYGLTSPAMNASHARRRTEYAAGAGSGSALPEVARRPHGKIHIWKTTSGYFSQ